MKWRRRSFLLASIAAISCSIASCSSFTTGSSSGNSNNTPGGGEAGTSGADGATLPDGGSTAIENEVDDGGTCLRPFASQFKGAVPLFDGFHRDAFYGDQSTLNLTSAIGTGGRGDDGVLKIDLKAATDIRGRALIRDVFVGSGPRRCATAKTDVHMRIVMKVTRHTVSAEAVLVMLARFDQQHDLLIGLNPSAQLEIAQQNLTATPKVYDTLGSYPLSTQNWHTIELSNTYDPGGVPHVTAFVNNQPVNISNKPPVSYLDLREFHVGALYANGAANAAYEIDEVSIF